jgi:hypothetical protein
MDHDALARLSREELLEVIRRQQAELAEREAAIERRDAKIRELEEELAQFRRPAKSPENSSVPPSRGPAGSGASRMSWSSAVRACVPAAVKGCRRPEDAESGAVR